MISLAVPLILVETSYMAIITTDVVMMGWLGPEALATGSLAGHFYAFFEYFAFGVLGAVAPMLSQHLGARRFRQVRPTMRQGFWVSIILAVPCTAAIWHAEAILLVLGQDPTIAADGQAYVRWMVLGLLPGMWFLILAEFLAAHERPRATLVVVVIAIGANALANYSLMFGHFGFPRLGLIGAGIGSALVSGLMCALLLGYVLLDRRFRRYRLLGRLWRIDPSQFREIFVLGIPIAMTALAEMGMFFASALLMGMIGTMTLAAHAVAVQCASIAYMVPFGLGQAASVRVGRAAGAGNMKGVSIAGWTALAMAVCFAFIPASAFLFFGEFITGLFLETDLPDNRTVIELAVSFLVIAVAFQFADATQATALGALRGLKDTRVPMIIALTGYWGIGLASAAVFGVYLDFGGRAVWLCMAVGLLAVAVALVLRFRVRIRALA